MSTVLENKPAARGGFTDKLAFFNGLRSVTNTIHSTNQLDEIILDLGRDICSLFGADRLTIYVACDDGKSIVTKVKTGLNSYKDFKLPVTDQSVAGYVALHKRIINIRDAYDAKEHARVAEMFATAVEEGMRTLKQDGIQKVLMGVTDIHQVRSVCIK